MAQRQQGAALGKRIASLTRFLLDHLSKCVGVCLRGAVGRHAFVLGGGCQQANPFTLLALISLLYMHPTNVITHRLLATILREARGEARTAAPNPTPPLSPAGRGPRQPPGRSQPGGPGAPPSPGRGAPGAAAAAAAGGGSKGDSRLAAAIEDLFGLEYKVQMTSLSGPSKGEVRERESRTFVVDLAYPSKEEGAATAAASAAAAGAPTPQPSPAPADGGAAGGERPAFGDLLANSLRAVTETRAWFDDGVGYAWVRQQRVPLKLPKVLVVNVATTDPADLALWEPQGAKGAAAAAEAGGGDEREGEPFAPWALQVAAGGGGADISVQAAGRAEDLPASDAPVAIRYELSGLICHIQDADEWDDASADPSAAAGAAPAGANPSAAAAAAAGGAAAGGKLPSGHLVALARLQKPYLDPETGLIAGRTSASGSGAGTRPGSSGGPDLAAAGGGTPAAAARVLSFTGGGRGVALPDSLDDVFADLAMTSMTDPTSEDGAGQQEGGAAAAAGKPPLPAGAGGGGAAEGEGEGGGGGGAGGGVARAPGSRHEWAVFNDFCIAAVPANEVLQWYGGQKRPCVLIYTQVRGFVLAGAGATHSRSITFSSCHHHQPTNTNPTMHAPTT